MKVVPNVFLRLSVCTLNRLGNILPDQFVGQKEDEEKHDGMDSRDNVDISLWRQVQENIGCQNEEEDGGVEGKNVVHSN